MYEEFFPERLSQLRQAKGVSARDMSLSLGQNVNYINNIENKKSLPSMSGFFYICDYFGITPQAFFDDSIKCPLCINDLLIELNKMDEELLGSMLDFVRGVNERIYEG